MKKLKIFYTIMAITILAMTAMPVSVFAAKFDDTYCEHLMVKHFGLVI